MCDRIIMPDGNEITYLSKEDVCLCGNNQKEILTWIVNNVPELQHEECLVIERDISLGYIVKINK
jgi:hypothetical protein